MYTWKPAAYTSAVLALCSNSVEDTWMERLRPGVLRLLAGAAGAASAAGACAAGGVLVASSETRTEPSAEPEPDTRPIEILVHNISHSDMLVMLGEDGDENGRTFLARPVFNKFQPVTEAILQQIAALKVRPTGAGTELGGLGLRRTAPHHAVPQHTVPRHARRPHPHPHLWQSMGQQPAVVDAPSKYQVPDRRKPSPPPAPAPSPAPTPAPLALALTVTSSPSHSPHPNPTPSQVRYPIGLSLSSQSKTAAGVAPVPERAQAGERDGGAGGASGASEAGGALLASSDLGVSSAELH